MAYAAKEIFYTLQGEGVHTGRAAVFCRFAGCNLWSGHEQDRATAVCQFCDTDFVGTDGDGGGKFATADELAAAIAAKWPRDLSKTDGGRRFVVCTGGEPLLQLDPALIDALHRENFTIAIETNGTIAVPAGVDWVCVSPKANTPLVVTRGDELKVVYPQETSPSVYDGLDFANWFIQPKDGPDAAESLRAAIRYCAEHPKWRLSLQTHKLIGIR
ncbi:MAG: 7-carboxy-7-deazaguanine synthase [Acidobacteriota bacterium]|nr:7-carboxy-7-deazaguanine synthase [Acidobacteriota bacterium]